MNSEVRPRLEPAKVRQLFVAAVGQIDRDSRDAFLREAAAGDEDLIQEVKQLLEAHNEAGSFLSPVFGETPSVANRPSEGAGTEIGPYRLVEIIGEGGMGTVYLAEQTEPVRRKVALKVIKPGMDSRQVVARFEAERQALALMDHPNIARVIDGGTTPPASPGQERPVGSASPVSTPPGSPPWQGGAADGSPPWQGGAAERIATPPCEGGAGGGGRPYFVMELVRGVPITEYCDLHRLSIPERLELFVLVCRAVQHAHQKGIIHRDIKPSNVLVTEIDGAAVPKVIDFGVAKAIGPALTELTLQTAFHQFVGTPLYMSPEQAAVSGVDVDTRSDIYSLGVLLYELLTGTTPFDPDALKREAFDEMWRILREKEPPRPSSRLSTLGETLSTVSARRKADPRQLDRSMRGELDWIVMKAIEKDRNRRYSTATGMVADIERYLHDEPVLACPPSRWYRLRKLARRNRVLFAGSAAMALVVVLGVFSLGMSNFLIRQEQMRTREEQRRAEGARRLAEERSEEIREGLERLKAANALVERGRWYAANHRWDDAHAAFSRAVELRSDFAAAWVERGDLLANLGLWDLAAADFAREFASREPETTSRWYRHALLLLERDDREGYQRVRDRMRGRFEGAIDGTFATDTIRTCVLVDAPEFHFEPLVERQRLHAELEPGAYRLYILGLAEYRAGRFEDAARHFEDSFAAIPGMVDALAHPALAMAYHRLGQSQKARHALQSAEEMIERWMRERISGGRFDLWATNLGATAHWPVAWWDWMEVGLLYREAKLLIEGGPVPDDPRLRLLRARAFAGLRWYEAAESEYDEVVRLIPDDRLLRLEANRCAGYGAASRERWAEAASEFSHAIELAPDEPYFQHFLAVALLASGDLEGYRGTCQAMLERFRRTSDRVTAREVIEACVLRPDALAAPVELLPVADVADPRYVSASPARATVLYRSGRFAESLACFETAARICRPRAWEWSFRAMALHQLGRDAEASRCLAEAGRWIDEANRRARLDPSGTEPEWGDWTDRIVCSLVYREAERLLKGGSAAVGADRG